MPYDDQWRAQWREQNADLVEFIQVPANQRASRFISSMASSFTTYGSLTEAQTRAARNVMRELSSDATGAVAVDDPNQPALADDALHIPNGVYTINDGSEHLTYRIHTVRNGSLRGKRIIKRQLAYGEFKGFGFITRQGGLKVWRSFYEDEAANERYIVWARLLVTALGERYADGYHADAAEFEFTYADGAGYTIQASVLCRRCNRNLTDPTSINLGIGPECRNLEQTARTTAAAPHEPVDIPPFTPTTLGVTITGDHIAQSSAIVNEADRIISVSTEPINTREQMLIVQCEQASNRRRANIFGPGPCLYCSRNDFRAESGRTRHMNICRRHYSSITLRDRCVRALGEYRARNNLVRDDGWADEYRRMLERDGQIQARLNTQNIRRAAPLRARVSSITPPGPVTPHLSALGTVIGGSVWEQ